ncbi:MAG: SRPBCC family protein [Flavobacteriales bacterium]|nr:SRPBCC family protein [Flavobacteriales bacterium]
MRHVLERRQTLPIPLRQAWDFFSDPNNLARITPPEMGFAIRGPKPEQPTYAGQRISYTVRPVLGIPLKWVTLIAVVDAPHRFVDTQEKGPYALWHHTHTFAECAEGTVMHDRVEYALPFGILGELAHRTFVKRQLAGIFSYREKVLKELFPEKK